MKGTFRKTREEQEIDVKVELLEEWQEEIEAWKEEIEAWKEEIEARREEDTDNRMSEQTMVEFIDIEHALARQEVQELKKKIVAAIGLLIVGVWLYNLF